MGNYGRTAKSGIIFRISGWHYREELQMIQRHIFGPVLSRRLGLSLGVDLILFKTCSYDCVYCECGPTTLHTITRQDFFPAEDVIATLRNVLASRPSLDTIRSTILHDPAVVEVRKIMGRNSGRYVFVEVDITLQTSGLERVHQISQRIEREIA